MSLLKRLDGESNFSGPAAQRYSLPKKETPQVKNGRRDPFALVKQEIHNRLIELLGQQPSAQIGAGEVDPGVLKATIDSILDEKVMGQGFIISKNDRQQLLSEVMSEAIGLGPIQPLIEDDTISEVMVNGPHRVYVERYGKIEPTGVVFRDDQHVHHIIEKIVAPMGRRIDESMPMVDARLPDGSRVNAIIPPLSLNGPVLTIRKFYRDPLTIDTLINMGTCTEEISKLVQLCVRARLNIVVSGGTGSGKTTMLNVLSSFIPGDERIVTIEDAAELQLRQEHVITLETRPPNIEGKGAITIRDLVRNALRMRPDRIVVGEVRSGEALDMLQAMNTGHDGCLTTGHANSPRDMISRLETMVLMAGVDLPLRAIREQIASAINLIVHLSRCRDGSRKVTHVTEVQGLEGDTIVLQDIFLFQARGMTEDGKVRGEFQSTGLWPKFTTNIEAAGLDLPPNLFARDADKGRWGG